MRRLTTYFRGGTTATGKALQASILTIILAGFFFQGGSNWQWASDKLGPPITTIESAWAKTKHGDLAAYADFLKKNLFKKDYPGHRLTVPDYRSTDVRFVRKLWAPIPSMFLFPIEIVVLDSYDFVLDEPSFSRLLKLPLTGIAYKDRIFYVVRGLEAETSPAWSLFLFDGPKYVHVFSLPEGYLRQLGRASNEKSGGHARSASAAGSGSVGKKR